MSLVYQFFLEHGVYVGALAYADDVTMLAPTPRAMQLQLQIREDYARNIVFNASKSATMCISRKKMFFFNEDLHFFIDGCLVEQGLTSHSSQFRSFRRRCFYRSDDPTNSVKALKEGG